VHHAFGSLDRKSDALPTVPPTRPPITGEELTSTCLSNDAGTVAQLAGPLASIARQEPRLLGAVTLHLGRRSVLLNPHVVSGLQLRAAQR